MSMGGVGVGDGGTGLAVGVDVGVDFGSGVGVFVGEGVGLGVTVGLAVAVGGSVGSDVGAGLAFGVFARARPVRSRMRIAEAINGVLNLRIGPLCPVGPISAWDSPRL